MIASATLAEAGTATALRVEGIDKRYGATRALTQCRFEVREGEVHGLVGANGAGKSTLVRILSGAVEPDAGVIEVGSWSGPALDPRRAQELGVATIYQDPDLVPPFDVAENIVLGREPSRLRAFQDRAAERRLARELAERVGLEARHVTVPVGLLSRAEQQLVEVAKALHRQVRVVLMDEPTAPLGPRDVERLEGVIRELTSRGVAIVYISHRLTEVLRICDRITVLRDGRHVWTRASSELTESDLVQAMIGHGLRESGREASAAGDSMLEVAGLGQGQRLDGIDLVVRRGEVVGLAGLVGAGRSRLLRVLAGAQRFDRGAIRLAGAPYAPRNPAEALRRGVGLIPEDRKVNGLFMDMGIGPNLLFARPLSSPGGLIRRRAESATVQRWRERLRIVMPRSSAPVSTLSGGNQQKVMLARWLHANVDVLLVDEPGQGVDVAGKQEVAAIIRDAARNGAAVVVSASESDDLFSLSDRIVVMRHGRIVGELDGEAATEEDVVSLASGVGVAAPPGPAKDGDE